MSKLKDKSRYYYQKRIKELEADNDRLREYRNLAFRIYNWLHQFGKSGIDSPDASYGLEMFKSVFK